MAQARTGEWAGTEVFPEAGDLVRAAETLGLLSHPARLSVLCHLSTAGQLSVGELVGRIGLSQSAVSQHLAKLRHGGLVEGLREGQTIRYRIAREDAARLLETLHELYCDHPGAAAGADPASATAAGS